MKTDTGCPVKIAESMAVELALDRMRRSWPFRVSIRAGEIEWSEECIKIPVDVQSNTVDVCDLIAPSVPGVAIVTRTGEELIFDASALGVATGKHLNLQ